MKIKAYEIVPKALGRLLLWQKNQ